MDNLKLLHALNLANRLYRRENHCIAEEDGRLRGKDLYGSGRLLQALIRSGDQTQKQLSERLEVRPQSLTAVLEKLESKGCIERFRSRDDRRVQIVHVTDKGKFLGAALHEARAKTADVLFACLSETEKEQLLALLNKIAEARQ
jgi:DNA-binding MarR family transcriptional regulator